jgi:hypothetical protein
VQKRKEPAWCDLAGDTAEQCGNGLISPTAIYGDDSFPKTGRIFHAIHDPGHVARISNNNFLDVCGVKLGPGADNDSARQV